MIRSMTGFGQASFEVEGLAFEVEVRSLNHRFQDVRVKLPRSLGAREVELRSRVQQRVRRGRVDVTVRPAADSGRSQGVEVDAAAAAHYLRAGRELAEQHGLPGELDLGRLLQLPGVARVVERTLEAEPLYAALSPALDRALEALEAMRQAEGAALARALEEGLVRILHQVEALEQRSERVQQAVRERLRKRAEQLRDETGILDEARLHQEIVMAADRLDIREELTRLRSHVDQFRSILRETHAEHPAGRRLNFLLQEMTREANTIGAKGADAQLASQVVELKTELERLREQVQNVE